MLGFEQREILGGFLEEMSGSIAEGQQRPFFFLE